MKKSGLTSLILFFITAHCLAQDIITKRNGEDVKAKVLEINETEVKYKRFDNPEGPTFIELKSNLVMIRYENGTQTYFDEQGKPGSTQPVTTSPATSVGPVSGTDLYTKGEFDATTHYTGYKAAGTGTLITSLLFPLAGLVPAVACSSTPPKDVNLGYPSSELMAKGDYASGYRTKAKSKKQGKVWMNWGIGLGVNVIAILLSQQ